jgi:histidyl-tRNA synthetase
MAEKPKKPQKLRARLPRGLEDRGPAAIAATRRMVEKIREVYERYGFEPVETPAMEFTDALGKFLPDQCSRSRTTTSSGSRCATI